MSARRKDWSKTICQTRLTLLQILRRQCVVWMKQLPQINLWWRHVRYSGSWCILLVAVQQPTVCCIHHDPEYIYTCLYGIYLYIRNIYTYIRSVFRVLMYTTYCWLLHDECCLKWGNLIFHPSPKVSFQSLWRTSNDIIQTFSLLVTISSF